MLQHTENDISAMNLEPEKCEKWEWYNNNKRELSYFSGRSIEEVVRKFNYGKLTTPTIFSIKLSPKS